MNAESFAEWARQHGWRVTSVTPASVTATRRAGLVKRVWIKQPGGWWKAAHKKGRVFRNESDEVD